MSRRLGDLHPLLIHELVELSTKVHMGIYSWRVQESPHFMITTLMWPIRTLQKNKTFRSKLSKNLKK